MPAERGPVLGPSGLPDGGIVDAAIVPGLADASSDGMEVASTVDPMLEALVARMPPALAVEARGMRNLFIINGCSPREARLKVAELYSPPRVTRELRTPVTGRACRDWSQVPPSTSSWTRPGRPMTSGWRRTAGGAGTDFGRISHGW